MLRSIQILIKLNQDVLLNLNLVESFILVPILKRVKLETKLKQKNVRVFKMNFTALPVYICENIDGLGL